MHDEFTYLFVILLIYGYFSFVAFYVFVSRGPNPYTTMKSNGLYANYMISDY